MSAGIVGCDQDNKSIHKKGIVMTSCMLKLQLENKSLLISLAYIKISFKLS
jgi:hypothetical protein